jgi:hypothetical protein
MEAVMRSRFSAGIIIGLLAAGLTSSHAQESSSHPSHRFFDLFKYKPPNSTKNLESSPSSPPPTTRQYVAIANINRHLEQVRQLRAQGKTPEAIHAQFHTAAKPAAFGSIAGIVYEEDGRTPAQQIVSVTAYDEYGRFADSDFIIPQGNGSYSLIDLPAGKFYVHAFSFDYYQDEYYDNTRDWRQATLVQVSDGQTTRNVNFALTRAEGYKTGQGVITGLVLSPNNTPVTENCSVNLFSAQGGFINSAVVDQNGRYTFAGLGSGAHLLSVDFFGPENWLSEYYEDAQRWESATPVQVNDPDTTRNIDFRLNLGGAIAGEVVDPSGQSVPAHEYDIQLFNLDGTDISTQPVESGGKFLVPRLRSGSYKLLAAYSGSQNYAHTWYGDAAMFDNATPVTVAAPDTAKHIRITLQAAGAISGRVVLSSGTPAQGVSIEAYNEQQRQVASSGLDGNGNYTLRQLPEGRYKLFASVFTFGTPQDPYSVWYENAQDFTAANFVEVIAPSTTSGINFTLRTGATIAGLVRGAQGQLLPNSGTILAYNARRESVSFESIGGDARYLLTGLPSGDYRLLMSYSGNEDYLSEWYDGQVSFETATLVNVTAPNPRLNVNFTLDPASHLNGFVIDDVGRRLSEEEAPLLLLVYEANSGAFVSASNNSFAGGYKFALSAGNYKFSAVSIYRNSFAQQDSLAVAYYERGTRFDDANAQTIALPARTSLKLNDLIVLKANGAIAGRIYTGASPLPVTGLAYYVFAFDDSGYIAKAATYFPDLNPLTGEYLLTGLRPGNYYVLAALANANGEFSIFQWFEGVPSDLTEESFLPKLRIPTEAKPVAVGQGLVTGKDFYFNRTTGIAESLSPVLSYRLWQNYPNPFNPTTKIAYELPEAVHVTIQVFNVLGEKVATLVDERQLPGAHVVQWQATQAPTGVYFCRMTAGRFQQTRKLLLAK